MVEYAVGHKHLYQQKRIQIQKIIYPNFETIRL